MSLINETGREYRAQREEHKYAGATFGFSGVFRDSSCGPCRVSVSCFDVEPRAKNVCSGLQGEFGLRSKTSKPSYFSWCEKEAAKTEKSKKECAQKENFKAEKKENLKSKKDSSQKGATRADKKSQAAGEEKRGCGTACEKEKSGAGKSAQKNLDGRRAGVPAYLVSENSREKSYRKLDNAWAGHRGQKNRPFRTIHYPEGWVGGERCDGAFIGKPQTGWERGRRHIQVRPVSTASGRFPGRLFAGDV